MDLEVCAWKFEGGAFILRAGPTRFCDFCGVIRHDPALCSLYDPDRPNECRQLSSSIRLWRILFTYHWASIIIRDCAPSCFNHACYQVRAPSPHRYSLENRKQQLQISMEARLHARTTIYILYSIFYIYIHTIFYTLCILYHPCIVFLARSCLVIYSTKGLSLPGYSATHLDSVHLKVSSGRC